MWWAYRWALSHRQREDNKTINMYQFISQFKHPILVVKTHKNDRDGNNIQEPVYVRFEDKVFKTEDESIANFLRGLKNFGHEYWEVAEVPSTAGYQGHSVGITKTDAPKTELPQTKVEALEKQVNQLTNLVGQLVDKLNTHAIYPNQTQSEEETEDKVDKRSKEYKEAKRQEKEKLNSEV